MHMISSVNEMFENDSNSAFAYDHISDSAPQFALHYNT